MTRCIGYDLARPEIRSGDLLAFSHRSWRSWYDIKVQAVRIATRSEYCHVGTAVVMAGRVWVLESVTPLVRLVPLSNELPAWWIPLGAPWEEETEQLAMSLIGNVDTQYSDGLAVRAFLGSIDPLAEQSRWMCAKLAWLLADVDGIDLGTDITPSGLVYAAQARGGPTYLLTNKGVR